MIDNMLVPLCVWQCVKRNGAFRDGIILGQHCDLRVVALAVVAVMLRTVEVALVHLDDAGISSLARHSSVSDGIVANRERDAVRREGVAKQSPFRQWRTELG